MRQILFFITLFIPALAIADLLDEIQARGELIVGVKTDYKPYGFINEQGQITGIEPELAQDVADKFNVKLKLVSVTSANRMEFLSQRRIDLMIATMTDKPKRREIVFASDPNYYSSGTNVLALKERDYNQWEDLFGKTVCGNKGAYYNQSIKDKYGANVVEFPNTKEALKALRGARCDAFVFDDSFLAGVLTDSIWSEYEMPFETIDDAPWALAVPKGENRLHTLMNQQIIDWHKSGKILGLEAKYGIKNTAFAVRMHKKYNQILKLEVQQ